MSKSKAGQGLTLAQKRDAMVLEWLSGRSWISRSKITHAFIRHGTRGGLKWTGRSVGMTLRRLEADGLVLRTTVTPNHGRDRELWRLV